MRRVQFLFVAAVSGAIAVPGASFAQSHPEFIALGRVSAALYKPDTGSAPHVGFVIGHRTANYLNHITCRELVLVPAGGNPGAGGDAKLATLDPTIADLQSTARPEKLLRNDGSEPG